MATHIETKGVKMCDHDFRATAAAFAAKLHLADRTAVELTNELHLAHEIILAMVREMTLPQKQCLSTALISRGVTVDGMTRHFERQDLISQAKAFAEQNWSTQ